MWDRLFRPWKKFDRPLPDVPIHPVVDAPDNRLPLVETSALDHELLDSSLRLDEQRARFEQALRETVDRLDVVAMFSSHNGE